MSIIVLDSSNNSREITKSLIEEVGFGDNLKLFSDYQEGLNEIKADDSPIVFVDISNDNDEIIENIRLFTPKIVATSTNYSTDIIVKAMRFGAKEFLTKPILKEDLYRTITTLSKQDTELDTIDSKIIAVYSNKGGIGKTTIASNLAFELSKTVHDKVALVDLNLQLGDISTFLNLKPNFDVAYVIKNLVSKKEKTILQAFEKYKNSKLYVLSDPNYIEQSESITPQEIEKLFISLKKVFPYIVVDMSSNIDPNSLKILDCSDIILFTTIINLPAIRNAQRCLNLFTSRYYSNDKIKVIINRFMENDDIKQEDIETALDEKIYWKIPNNYFSIMESINRGITVSEVNPNSNIADSFRSLSLKLADEIAESSIIKYRI